MSHERSPPPKMLVQKYQKWLLASIFSWASFFAILFGAVIKKTSIVQEYGCTVEEFTVIPRFECDTRCPIIAEVNSYYAAPDCDELKKSMLDWYDPRLCLDAKWGFEDPLCPPDASICYVGDKWRRKCYLSCPLAYEIDLKLDVEHLGSVKKGRDLETDREKYESYRETYHVGDSMTCQVVKIGNGDEHDVLWVDERISSKTISGWKWGLLSASTFAVFFTTLMTVISALKYRSRQARGYGPVDDGTGASTS